MLKIPLYSDNVELPAPSTHCIEQSPASSPTLCTSDCPGAWPHQSALLRPPLDPPGCTGLCNNIQSHLCCGRGFITIEDSQQQHQIFILSLPRKWTHTHSPTPLRDTHSSPTPLRDTHSQPDPTKGHTLTARPHWGTHTHSPTPLRDTHSQPDPTEGHTLTARPHWGTHTHSPTPLRDTHSQECLQ